MTAVTFGMFMSVIVSVKDVKLCDPGLNRFREIRPKAARDRIFGSFYSNFRGIVYPMIAIFHSLIDDGLAHNIIMYMTSLAVSSRL